MNRLFTFLCNSHDLRKNSHIFRCVEENYPGYWEWALKLSRRGTLIIADNVVRNGDVVDSANTDPRVQAVRRLHEMIAAERRVSATAIQTVGSKGYDGFTLAVVGDI